MPYRAPGAYARFVRTAGAVNSVGSTRVLALVGTGVLTYDVYNEAIERDQDRAFKPTPYDMLSHDNVFEIKSITNKPKVNGVFPAGTITWEKDKHFFLKENKYIVWYTDPDNPATVQKVDGIGNDEFANHVTVIVDTSKDYLVEDNTWKIEITYVDPVAGSYRVINLATNEVVGEYGVSTSPIEVIPGVKLTVDSTFVDDGSGNSLTQVGDYVIIETKAAVVPDQYVEKDGSGNPIPGTEKDLPQPGDLYYVTYTYKKSDDDLGPKLFFDYDDVVNEYGNYEILASNKVINSLALGAEIAFLNGAGPIVCVQARNDSDYEMKLAIDKLRKGVKGLNNIHIVVPLTTSPEVGAHVMNHVTDMSSPENGKERMTYLAIEKGKTIQDIVELAKSYNNERVVLVAPEGAYKSVKDLRTGRYSEKFVDGSYLAVAIAATSIKNDPAEPLTNKTIVGFEHLSTIYEESEMNMMADAGVLILKQNGPNIKIRHGITTAAKDVNSAEITLVQIKDYVIEEVRKTLGELYVGNKLRPSILNDVESTLLNILNQFIRMQIIIGYNGISVKRSKDDPRQIDVKFEIEAVYPLNYIMIEFGFSQVS